MQGRIMLPFRTITIEDKPEVDRLTSSIPSLLCEHCFVDLFIWWDHYNTEICFQDGFLFVRCVSFPDKQPLYLAPIGQGDLKAAVQAIQKDAAARNVPFVMVSIPEDMLPTYESLFHDQFSFNWSEDSADYIYLSEKLSTLSGKKLQSKRNLVNRFKAAYEGRWRYEDLSPQNTEKAYDFHIEWCRQREGCVKDESFLGEACAVKIALDHFEILNLRGGLLYLDERVIAYTFGCRARDNEFVVQIEKANPEISGAYQMINQQFILANCQDVVYINREEDLGLEGLRKAKRSYYPAFMGKKYFAVPYKEAYI